MGNYVLSSFAIGCFSTTASRYLIFFAGHEWTTNPFLEIYLHLVCATHGTHAIHGFFALHSTLAPWRNKTSQMLPMLRLPLRKGAFSLVWGSVSIVLLVSGTIDDPSCGASMLPNPHVADKQ